MSILILKLARRDENGRYTSLITLVRKLALYGLITVTIAGVGFTVIRGGHFVSISLHRNVPGQQGSVVFHSESIGSGCKKSTGGNFDCTDEATKAKVYEAAKSGIRWHTKPETNEEKLEAVCQSKGINDNDCPRILKAMAMQESGFGKWMVGDSGKSHGFFHILNIHKDVSLKCALDISCSASWTLSRMIRNGYMQDKWKGVASHNSYTPSVGAAYAKAVKKQLAKL